MDIKVFTEDGALELAEKLLQNDKDIKEELEQKGYATESFVAEKIAEAQLSGGDVDLSGYAKTEDLSNYALKSEVPNLDGYAKIEDIPDEYDDTALSNRVTTVENDYLKSSDKTELTQAIATAKAETIETILGEAVDADFDTLQEVADWIQADTTASAELVVRVTDAESDIATIQNDYLKSVDKTELLSSISTNTTAISKNTTDIAKNTTAIEENTEAITDNATAIAVERARIDAFTALPEGSTTGDAALEDIKIKVDGTTADTAGNAVREQINTLDDKIDEEVGKLSSEIVDYTNSMENYVLNNSKRIVAIPSGSFGRIEHTNGKYSDYESGNQVACKPFIRLHKGEVYLLKPLDNAIRYNLYFYDENKNFIEAITTNDNMVYNVYQFFSGRNYAYCRIATWKSGNTIETFNSAFELIAFINIYNPLENYQNAINYNNGVYRPFIGTGVIGSEISETTGVFRASTSQNVIASEDFIRMEKGKKYIFSTISGVIFNLYFYDENKNFIRAYSTNSSMSATTKIVNNTEYSFCRIGMYKSGATIEDWKSFRVVSNEKDFKVVFFGDSITAGVGTNKTYAMWLAEYFGWTCLNYGIGGTGYLNNMKGNNSIAGDGVEGVGISRDITEDSDYLSRVSTLPMDADLYVIGGGYNDWNTNRDIETFKEQAEKVYSYILTNNPNAKILVLTPTRQYTSEKDSRNPNTIGKTLEDYANAIKEVCENMSIRCKDLYHCGGLFPVTSSQSTKYFADGLHPNANGDRVIANKIARTCEELVGQLI